MRGHRESQENSFLTRCSVHTSGRRAMGASAQSRERRGNGQWKSALRLGIDLIDMHRESLTPSFTA